MPFKKITNQIYLGDQFSKNLIKADKELKISNIYYSILNKGQEEILFNNKAYVLTKTKIAINMFDSHDPADFTNNLFAPAIKFLVEESNSNLIYTHCQLGVSRSASTIFIYLVITNQINSKSFSGALKIFLHSFYPYMKVNFGIYTFLKQNFPFNDIKILISKKWGEI